MLGAMDRRPLLLASRVALVPVTLAATAVTFGPYARSGTRVRSSYELVDVAAQADLVPAPLDRFAVLWFLVPALCGVVLITFSTQRHRVAGSAAITLGALVAASGALVQRSALVLEPAGMAAVPLGVLTVIAGATVVVLDSRGGGAT